jgi:hypothetical protein
MGHSISASGIYGNGPIGGSINTTIAGFDQDKENKDPNSSYLGRNSSNNNPSSQGKPTSVAAGKDAQKQYKNFPTNYENIKKDPYPNKSSIGSFDRKAFGDKSDGKAKNERASGLIGGANNKSDIVHRSKSPILNKSGISQHQSSSANGNQVQSQQQLNRDNSKLNLYGAPKGQSANEIKGTGMTSRRTSSINEASYLERLVSQKKNPALGTSNNNVSQTNTTVAHVSQNQSTNLSAMPDKTPNPMQHHKSVSSCNLNSDYNTIVAKLKEQKKSYEVKAKLNDNNYSQQNSENFDKSRNNQESLTMDQSDKSRKDTGSLYSSDPKSKPGSI